MAPFLPGSFTRRTPRLAPMAMRRFRAPSWANRSVTTERFAHDGARNLRMAIGAKRGVRRVNEPGKNGAIIQAKAGATWEGENGEIRCGGAHDHRNKKDG